MDLKLVLRRLNSNPYKNDFDFSYSKYITMKTKMMQLSVVLFVWINVAILVNADGKEAR